MFLGFFSPWGHVTKSRMKISENKLWKELLAGSLVIFVICENHSSKWQSHFLSYHTHTIFLSPNYNKMEKFSRKEFFSFFPFWLVLLCLLLCLSFCVLVCFSSIYTFLVDYVLFIPNLLLNISTQKLIKFNLGHFMNQSRKKQIYIL